MSQKANEMLSDYSQDDFTVKLLSSLDKIVPGSPGFKFYNNFEDGVKAYVPDASPEVIEKARALAESEEMQDALKVMGYIDTSDKVIAGYAGIKNVLSLFGGGGGAKKRTFESDPQQALDAGVKALAIAYAVYKLIPGGVSEKVSQFKELDAGKEMAIYFASIEVALPFLDNAVEGGAGLIQKLMNSNSGITDKFGSLAGGGAAQATEMLNSLAGPLDSYIGVAKDHAGTIADKVKSYLPAAANVADSATGAVATGADLLPVWTFLGARLVTEVAARRAAEG
ncbi:MAG: hypothetical protein RH862_09385 [Leptospiraceae bacterium]